jgi:hypothetical protein
MSRQSVFCFLFFVAAVLTAIVFVLDMDMFRFPMLLTATIFMAVWLFLPTGDASVEGKSAFYALVTYGIASILLSYTLYLMVPVYGQQWGVEYNPNDAGGVVFPIVNDTHENCVFTTVIFIFYFVTTILGRLRQKAVAYGG